MKTSGEHRALRIACVVGARPNFVKMAPLLAEMRKYPSELQPILVHTGQHYDHHLSTSFFKDLNLPEPDHYLGARTGSPAEQTAAIVELFDELCGKEQFDRVLLVGDVTSTLACALSAAKRLIPVDHVEAGLRSFDRTMPEEINRLVTDLLSSYCFVSEPSGVQNLAREGRVGDAVRLVGNVMIDTLMRHLPAARALRTCEKLQLKPGGYGVLTLHRPSNVDDAVRLRSLLDEIGKAGQRLPFVFPVHPRTRKQLHLIGLEAPAGLRLVDPLGYIEFLGLMADARVVVTDSGGIQEETTALQIPCLTMRSNTERPLTVIEGSSTLVPDLNGDLGRLVDDIIAGRYKRSSTPALWDGRASERIVAVLRDESKRVGTGA